MAKKNETVVEETTLATTSTEALAVADDDSGFGEFSDDADKRTKDELVLERLRIVQAMTKAKAKNKALRDGQIYGNMSLKGFDKLLVVPVYDYRTVVERVDDNKGKFLKEHLETADGSGDFGDIKVQKSIAAVGGDITKLRKSVPDANGVVTSLSLTYNSFVAILDPSDGVTVTGFGLLQADKTNIRPYLLWRQNRVCFDGAVNYPTYAFRTFVDGKGEYTNPDGITTQQYQFTPYLNDNWKESCFSPRNPKQLEVLRKLQEQRKLMQSGAIKVAENEESHTEEAAEEAAF